MERMNKSVRNIPSPRFTLNRGTCLHSYNISERLSANKSLTVAIETAREEAEFEFPHWKMTVCHLSSSNSYTFKTFSFCYCYS